MARKGTPEIEQDIYDALEIFFGVPSDGSGSGSGSGQPDERPIRGALYQEGCRPLDSKAEDAVITVSTAGGGQIQEGKAKVNIYVPDIDNGSGLPVPDKGRIQELSALGEAVIQALNDADTDYEFTLDPAPKDYVNHENKQHFVSIGIAFQRITFNQ